MQQTDTEAWNRVEWIPQDEAIVGDLVDLPIVKLRIFREYEVLKVYHPPLPEEMFK